MQAQDLARLRDLDDQTSAITVSSHQLCAPLAKYVHAPRHLALDKDQCAFRVSRGMLDVVEAFQ
jgi:hypothetical protein